MIKEKFLEKIGDNDLNDVVGGYQGNYQQIYGVLKANGVVNGDINGFKEISSPEEMKKVQGILSNIFGGAFEIGQYTDKENAYWLNGEAVTQTEVVMALRTYFSNVNARRN